MSIARAARETRAAPVLRSPGRCPSDLGYLNARVRGMQARLLTQSLLDELAACTDLPAVVDRLSGTGYGPDLARRLLGGTTALAVDGALRENMTRTYRDVWRLTDEATRGLLASVFGYWDVYNIKTVLRGKHLGLSPAETAEGFVPAGGLGQGELEELARQEGVQGVLDTLGQWGFPTVVRARESLPRYLERGDLMALELALDREYHKWATARTRSRGRDASIARWFLGTHVDAINVLTCLRLVSDGVGGAVAERYFMPGGATIGRSRYRILVASQSVEELVRALANTRYGPLFEEPMDRYAETGSLSVLERALERVLNRAARDASRADPLGIGVVIGYLWLKADEVTNVRIIVKGVAIGMPRETVKEALIGA